MTHLKGLGLAVMLIKIETYWNVNCIAENLCIVGHLIKIETYWNVNASNAAISALISY